MEFSQSLKRILDGSHRHRSTRTSPTQEADDVDDDNTATHDAQLSGPDVRTSLCASLEEWNNEIEHYFKSMPHSISNPNRFANPAGNESDDTAESQSISLQETCSLLQACIVSVSMKNDDSYNMDSSATSFADQHLSDDETADEHARMAAAALTKLPWFNRAATNSSAQQSSNSNSSSSEIEQETKQLNLLCELLRAAQNIIGWRSQVFLPHFELVLSQPQRIPNSTNTSNSKLPPVATTIRLCTNGMLEFYLTLLQTTRTDVARFASLSLFRATFDFNKGNSESPVVQLAQSYLVHTLNGASVLMNLLLQPRPVDLVLSLIKHVHNLVLSVKASSKLMDQALLSVDSKSTPLWFLQTTRTSTGVFEGEDNNDTTTIATTTLNTRHSMTLTFLLVNIATSYLNQSQFPGERADRRSEVVLEIMFVLFAIRAAVVEIPSSKNENNSLEELTLHILRLNNNDDRSYQCKLATIQLLMNAPRAFSDYLVAQDCIEPLLEILDKQISDVGDRTGSGPTLLVPILFILNKLSAVNATALKIVKEHVFPPGATEQAFQDKAVAETAIHSKKGLGARNMSPLDAPGGSLRWKLTRLMTSTESYSKRAAGELMWTLCACNAREYILRTGFGNAYPILGLKGYVQLPTNT